MKPVDQMRDTVKAAGVAGKYPQLMSLVRGMDQADADFVAVQCSDAAGSPCVKDVTTIMDDSMDLTNMLPDPR